MEKFRAVDISTPVVVVPTSFNSVTVEEFIKMGVNVVISANHMLRAAYPSMQKAAHSILKNKRSYELENKISSVKEVINLIK